MDCFSIVTIVSCTRNHFKVDTLSGSTETYVFSTNDKNDTLRWIEAIDSCVQLDPSPVLLHATGGAILHTGFLNCHKYHNGSNNHNPLQPMVNMRLGESESRFPKTANNCSANYGKLWSVLKQTGEVECMVDGKPERLISIKDCSSVRVLNPLTMREGSDYCLKFIVKDTVYVLKAEFPTDHYDWTMAIEKVLQDSGKSRILVGGDKSRENGYVALKRLMSLQKNGGIRGSQLMSPMVELEALQDLYDNSVLVNRRASPDGCEEKFMMEGPPVPPRGSSAPPPPLPPKDPPPLPPKRGGSLQRVRTPSMASNGSGISMEYDEYVTMQPPPSSLKLSSPIHMMQHSTANCSIPSPITEGDDYMPMNAVVIDPAAVQRKENIVPPSQPISIPNMPVKRTTSGKRSILLRSTSDSDSSMVNIEVTPPLPPRGPSPRHHHTSSLSSSLSRNPSASSITSLGSSANSTNFYPRSVNDRCFNLMGNRAPMFIPRSNSVVAQPISPRRNKSLAEMSASDGMIVRDAREKYNQEMLSGSYVGSVSSVVSSENGLDISGISSSSSSIEDICQVLE